MANSDVEKVLAVFAGISAGNVHQATEYIDHTRFVQHDPYAADGVEGLSRFISKSPRDQLQLSVVRAFQDGPYVVTQAKGQRSGRNIFFDIFRFEGSLVVEHWAFSAMDAPPNQSGHSSPARPRTSPHNLGFVAVLHVKRARIEYSVNGGCDVILDLLNHVA